MAPLVGLCGTANDAILELLFHRKFAGALRQSGKPESVVGLLGGTVAGFLYRVFLAPLYSLCSGFHAAKQTVAASASLRKESGPQGRQQRPGTGGKPKNGAAEAITRPGNTSRAGPPSQLYPHPPRGAGSGPCQKRSSWQHFAVGATAAFTAPLLEPRYTS